MKNTAIRSAVIALSLGILCGCTPQTENKAAQTSKKTINDILAESQAKMTTEPATINYPPLDFTADIDLTTLNANMVYSTVYSMVNSSSEYSGKTVKASGTFDVFTTPATGEMYYTCVVADATACCAQGLEFVPAKALHFPDDFPEEGTPITVGGVFETYEEDGKTYCRLTNADFVF